MGGGFSAGKSQFVSSFFADNTIELPIGVTPVTAIASYIVHGDSHIIKGYTYKDGIIDVPLDLYAKLSHDFIKELGFNLKDILPMMVMETPIPEYQHICFIDTPGYNPSDSGHTGRDKESASEYLANANALIWLISAQAGTFPASDLAFLDSLNLEGKKLYILLNKADLKPKSEIESILDELEGVLEDNYMEYEGISAYDSRNKQELAYRKQPLKDFLHSVDKDIASREQLKSELDSVFAMYEGALEADRARLKNMRSIIGSLELDILQSGVDFDDRGEAVAQESEEEEEDITDKLVLLEQMGDRIKAISDDYDLTDKFETIQDALEYGDEDIRRGLAEEYTQLHTESSERFKRDFTELDTEQRALVKLVLEYLTLAIDTLLNGRYIEPEKSEDDEAESDESEEAESSEQDSDTNELGASDDELELMSEKIAARFETLRGFVSLGEIDKHSKELASLKAKMSEALESLIVEIFEKSADS